MLLHPGKSRAKTPGLERNFRNFRGGVRSSPGGLRVQNFVKFVYFFPKNSTFFTYGKSITTPEFQRKIEDKNLEKMHIFYFTFLGQRDTKKVTNYIIFLLRKIFMQKFVIFFAIFCDFFEY